MELKYESLYKQALDMITEMGLSPELCSEGYIMHSFLYKEEKLFIGEGETDKDIELVCPVYLNGTEEEQKELLDKAQGIAENELQDFDVEFLGMNLAYIVLNVSFKKNRHNLKQDNLVYMLDKILDGHKALMSAIGVALYTQSPETLASIINNEKEES